MQHDKNPTPKTSKSPVASAEQLYKRIQEALDSTEPYEAMNALRDWFNGQFLSRGFELYLEDVWNERQDGETWLEYILRSLHTYNETPPIAWDIYLNRQDDKGVWHLGDYQQTQIALKDPQELIDFMAQNGNPWI